MAVTKTKIKQSPLKFGMGGASASITWEIAGTDLAAFITEIFGSAYYTGQGYTILNRANHPGYSWLYADDISAEPKPPESPPAVDQADYDYLWVTVAYKAECLNKENGDPGEKPETPAETWLTWDIDGGAEMMTLPEQGFVWQTADAAGNVAVGPDVNPGIVIPTEVHTITWSNVATPPWAAMRERIGKINADAYIGAEAGTLLFAGYKPQVRFNADGEKKFSLTYTFICRRVRDGDNVRGWNYAYHSAIGAWDLLNKKSNPAEHLYLTTGFMALFQYGT